MSDGTEVELGGVVHGSTEFARELREDLAGRYGPPTVQIQAMPTGADELDANDPTMVDMWLRQRGMGRGPGRERVTVRNAPAFERRVFEMVPDDTPPGAVN